MAARIGAETYRHNYSMDFTRASTTYLESSRNRIAPTSGITVSYWMKTTSSNNTCRQVAQDALGSTNRYWMCWYRGTYPGGVEALYFTLWNTDDSGNSIKGTDSLVSDGLWHHIFCTYDGTSDMMMYVDGVLDVSGTTVSTGIRAATGLGSQIYISSTGNYNFPGSLDEVAIWEDTALTQSDAIAIYNNGTPIPLDSYNPTVWYRMGDGKDDYWNGSEWTIIDKGTANASLVSYNMVEGDRKEDYPGK